MSRIALTVLASLLLLGCSEKWTEYVVVTAVACEPQMGMKDCVTTVVTLDGTRRPYQAQGTWGAVGDTLRVEIVRDAGGESRFRSPR